MASFKFVLLAAALLVGTSSPAPQNTKFGITVPEECRGKGFCAIRPEGYDEIEAQINKLFPLHLIAQDIGSRSGGGPIGDPSDGDDNCPSETTWESVYIYDDPSRTKVDIIVQTELFPQKVAKVTCKYNNEISEDGDSQCFRALGLRELNMKTRCEKMEATRSLMVFDPEYKHIKMKNYTFPVSCSCRITRTV